MDFLRLVRREGGESSGLGLGWLLVLAIGGGVLLFTAVGLLLAWRIKARGKPVTTRVYAQRDDHPEAYELPPSSTWLGSLTASSTTRLVKKSRFASESSFSRLSSKTFLPGTLPPILPPLPTYHSFLEQRTVDEAGVAEAAAATTTTSPKKNKTKNKSSIDNTSTNDGGSKTRSRNGSITNWVDEEALHGPVIKRMSFRESWFSKDSWLLRSPTLPNVADGVAEEDQQKIQAGQQAEIQQHSQQKQEHLQHQPQPGGQKIEIQKRQSKTLSTSQTAPELLFPRNADGEARGRQRVIAQTQNPPVRPCATATDLRDILALTEQRLREGVSQSPTKRMRDSPVKSGGVGGGGSVGDLRGGSPVKMTPRGCRAGTPGRGSLTSSTSKRHAAGTPTPSKGHSRNASVRNASISSISSAANSLIRAATQELELPDGGSSPRRVRAKDWEPSRQTQLPEKKTQQQQRHIQIQEPQKKPHRSSSVGSDASSSLSTLYSVGESEDHHSALTHPSRAASQRSARPQQRQNTMAGHGHDPFVDAHSQFDTTRQQLTGPRPFRRSNTVSGRNMTDESAIPAPLRTISVNTRIGRPVTRDSLRTDSFKFPMMAQPRKSVTFVEDNIAREELDIGGSSLGVPKRESISAASSESSMVSVSVYSESTITELPTRYSDGEQGFRRDDSPTPPPRSGPVPRGLDLSSSPLDEREVLSILQASTRPRNLPTPPPSRIFALRDCGTATPTPLSPRPRSRNGPISSNTANSLLLFPTSGSSSEGLGAFPAPSRRSSTSSSVYDQDSVSTTIFEDSDAPDLLAPQQETSSGLGLKTVGSTVAELRRMDSVYSLASAASTYFR